MNQVFNNVIKQINQKFYKQKVLLAVSTGVDSMVLLDLFLKANVQIAIAHINHNQREQSIKEQEYIVNYCDEIKIPCFVKELEFSTHQNFQAEARQKRYEFFKEVMKKENIHNLVTAHHANDDLETILMRLIKSTSLKGYAGIELESKLGEYNIYRPLLYVSKEEIKQYALSNNLTYFEDSSNKEDDYFRNRIRHQIIPSMEKENPSLYKEVKIFKEHILEVNNLLFEKINNFIKKEVSTHNNIISIKQVNFLNESRYLQEQILFEILKPYKLSKNLIEELLKQIRNDKNLIINEVTDELIFIKEYGYIKFQKKMVKEKIDILINGDVELKIDEFTKINVDKNICYFETEKTKLWYNISAFPVRLRNKLPGDKMIINGKTKSVSDYLTDKKVSHTIRPYLLVLVNNENQVLYILGIK